MAERVYVGGYMSDEDAQRIGRYLERTFGERPEGITPAEFVEAATPLDSEIHDDLEWDDAAAGHQHRLGQARRILREIEIVYVDRGGEQPQRAYQSVVVELAEGARRAYVPAAIVWSEPDLAQQVVEQALAALRGWSRRYRRYSDLATLAERVDQLLLELDQ